MATVKSTMVEVKKMQACPQWLKENRRKNDTLQNEELQQGFACVTKYIRRCQWILTRNEWWYTFTLANFRGDEGSGRVGRQGQGLSSHQFCPGSQQSTMAGIQRFNQSVNKEVHPNPFPTCFIVSIFLQLLLDWAGSVLSASLHLIIHVPVWLSQFQQKMLLLQVLVISNMTNRE